MRQLFLRIRHLLRRRQFEDDLAEELASHRALKQQELEKLGRSPDEAAMATRRALGSQALALDEARDVWLWPWVQGATRDARDACRVIRRSPGFAAVAGLTLALGIGLTTTLFSITYGVLLKPLPWPDSDRLVRLTESRKGREPRVKGTIANGPYHSWTADHSTIDALGGWLRQTASTLTIGTGEPAQIQTTAVTPSLFGVLRARPLAGRLFVDGDASTTPAASGFMILSYGLWQERFGGAEDAIGRAVRLGGRPVTIVGVMPKEFVFPDRETRAWTPWVPPTVLGDDGTQRMTIFSAIARLKPGSSPEQASAEGTARARQAPDPGLTAVALFGGNEPAEIRAIPAVALMTTEVRPALVILLAAVALLLLTATANIALLELARATTRRREIAIRAAMGAGAAALSRQLVAESTLLGAGGGIAGLALTVGLHRVLPSVLPADFPRVDAIAVDWRVMSFIAVISIVASVACGLLPAWHARRVDLVELLSEDGIAPVGGGRRTRTARARALLLAGQIAMSCLLLVGAALLVRSFIALTRADRGYDPSNMLSARLSFPPDYSLQRRTALLDHVVERVRTLPGIQAAAYGNALPLLTSGGFRAFRMRPPANPSIVEEVNIVERVVSPDYAAALGLRVLGGRTVSATDTMTSRNVIAVNRSFASRYLGARPLGTFVPNLGMCRGNDDRWEVVGVIDDIVQDTVAGQPQPEVFLPASQVGCPAAFLQTVIVLRTAADPARYAAPVRSAIHEQEPSLAVDSVMTMEDRVMRALARPRLYAVVLTGFACSAVVIAAVGLFGVVSFTVAQRSREIGIRTALGATRVDIGRLVLRQAAAVTAAGIGLGLLGAAAASGFLATQLYGVKPHDVLSFAVVAVVVAGMSGIACLVPAHRAARIDPLKVLR
jgi:putative ABC transport system permease protein